MSLTAIHRQLIAVKNQQFDGVIRLKRSKKIAVIFAILVFLLTMSVIVSINKFNTLNPILSGMGLVKIMFTKAEIVQIQDYPQVYLTKPDNAQQALINFMKSRGYYYLEDERMASTYVFGNEISKYYVDFSVNAYYSKWVFRE
ncbi:MAG: hypothetical protein H0Z40_09795 [Desulfotomaculum sp.]|nr:hypothetical protein [Desulfotomaculum sp.]